MRAVSWAGNKGQTKPEFLVLNFMFRTGISVHHSFKLSGGQKIPLEILSNPTGIYILTITLPVCVQCLVVRTFDILAQFSAFRVMVKFWSLRKLIQWVINSTLQ